MTLWLQTTALVVFALALGFALAHAAELPGKLRLDRRTYLAVQPMYHPGFTVGGFSEPLSIFVLAWLWWRWPEADAARIGISAALAGAVAMQAVYWLAIHPINRFWLKDQTLPRASARFFGSAEAAADDADRDWKRLRNRWEYAHLARAAIALPAFAALAWAIARA